MYGYIYTRHGSYGDELWCFNMSLSWVKLPRWLLEDPVVLEKNKWKMVERWLFVCKQLLCRSFQNLNYIFFYINAYIDEKNAKETIYSFKRIHCISKFECNYIYLDHPFGCQISAPNGLVLVVKGPKFQTLEGFRYTCYKSHLANGPWNKTLNFTYFPY